MRLFKKLDQFVLGNFLTLFAGTFAVSLFVVMMQFLWKFVDDLVGKGLSMDVLAKFFYYAAETLVPIALPLAILLAALISFGNMGERLELLSMKAAGIPLVRIMRPLAVLAVLLTGWSYYEQDVVAPAAQNKLYQLIYSMRQKSPELDIPEGVFYDGVQGMNLFVSEKDWKSGLLKGIIIYNLRDGANNAHIILADSGQLVSSEDKEHLLLHLYHGEQFENLRTNALATNNVPYRRETFVTKHFIIDFDQNFSLTDLDFSGSARTKNVKMLQTGIDSLTQLIDSTSRAFYEDMKHGTLYLPGLEEEKIVVTPQETKVVKLDTDTPDKQKTAKTSKATTKKPVAQPTAQASPPLSIDSLFMKKSNDGKMDILQRSLQRVSLANLDTDFKVEVMKAYSRDLRLHEIQIWQKITLALSCLLFFFIGAPLGAIIRKGGLGMPVVVAVVFFIFYYIIDKLGYNLAYAGTIPPAVGMLFSTAVLAPIGAFLTIKSNNDSVVFNIDAYIAFFRRLWGIRPKRHITRKEVIINDPDYPQSAQRMATLVDEARLYRRSHHLTRFPNYYTVFFQNERDEEIEKISQKLEYCVDDLSNSRNRQLLRQLNGFPVLDPHAHTAPFRKKSWNMVAGIVFPVGLILVFRMARFRRRLRHDLKQIITTGEKVCGIIADIT